MVDILSASEIIPELSVSQRLFDVPASDPLAGLLFLTADRRHHDFYSAQHLGDLLITACNQQVPEMPATHLKTESIMRRVGQLADMGYFSTVPRRSRFFTLKPDFLTYKRQLVTNLLTARLDFPDTPVADMLGKVKPNPSFGSAPSISLVLYRILLDHDNHLLPPALNDDLLQRYGLGNIPPMNVSSRITTLRRKGLLEKNTDGTRLRADLLPFAARLVQCVDELTFEQANDPEANLAAEAQAEAILTNPRAIQSLLAARIKRPQEGN